MPCARGCRALPLVAFLAVACACGDPAPSQEPAPAWPAGNLLANPGFEEGRAGWSYRKQSPHWGNFAVVEQPVHSGRRAVHLRINHSPGLPPREVKVYGTVQELRPRRFPDTVGGFYRVDRWEKTAPATDLYLQVVVIVWLDKEGEGETHHLGNRQVRYYLAGIEQAPFRLANARVRFIGSGPPALGEWVRFEIPLRRDFERLWGEVPERFERISVLYEARWDNMPAGSGVVADVYYDDLFVGYDGEAPAPADPAG